MKIIAISRDHSTHETIGLVTAPVIVPEVYEEAKMLAENQSELSNVLRGITAGCLVIDSDRFSPELRSHLEDVLSRAEEIVDGTLERKTSEAEQHERRMREAATLKEKDINLESASSGFGIPIE